MGFVDLVRARLRRVSRSGEEAPSTEAVLRRIRGLEIRTRGLVESIFSGEYASVFTGRGMEFSHVRGYQVGDDVRTIDWRVTARKGSPFVRQFVEERDLLVLLLVDVSGSGRFGPGERSAGEIATEIAAALAFAAARNNDRIGLILFSEGVEYLLVPGSGRRHLTRLLTQLLTHRPQGVGTDLSTALAQVTRLRSGRATVFVISDFIHPAGESTFRSSLLRLAQQHDLVAIRLASEAIDELPNVGWVEVTDPETGRRIVVDTGSRRVRERYRKSVLQAQGDTARLLSEAGAELIDVNTAADPLSQVTAFFRRRQKAGR